MRQASDSSHSSGNPQTYEAEKARRFTEQQPDKITYERSTAFREEPYRQLHHQNGFIGTFTIRLLEASDLKRSYWSPLALGPVKHLGLSKAHGEVSSFCSFSLGFHDLQHRICIKSSDNGDQKPAALPIYNQKHQMTGVYEWKSSPVVEFSNNPVWDHCVLDFPLRKGATRSDGMGIILNVRLEEETTAVENFIPGIIPYGGNQVDRLLGCGEIDLTELLFGETNDGNPVPGVRDEWIPLMLKQNLERQEMNAEQFHRTATDPLHNIDVPSASTQHNEMNSITGMVRVLVSYHPNGLDPEKNDVVALESFARRSISKSSCRPLLEPLQPLTVLDRRGSYLLCSYSLLLGNSDATICRSSGKQATVRIHRNAVFVIERQNIFDVAHNLLLLPIDVALATPLGQAASVALAPVLSAGSELLMPTLLSLKLLWMATRATAVASFSGVNALTSTLWREGSSSLLHDFHRSQSSSAVNVNTARNEGDGRLGTAQFVKL